MAAQKTNFVTYGSNALDVRYTDNSRSAIIIDFPLQENRPCRTQRETEKNQSILAKLAAKSNLVNTLIAGSITGVNSGSFTRAEIACAFGVGIIVCAISLYFGL